MILRIYVDLRLDFNVCCNRLASLSVTMDFSRFTSISFDCYGTLIDWESGILPALRRVLGSHGQSQSVSDAAILELYGEFEAETESGPYQNYRDVLQSLVPAFTYRFHFDAHSA